MSLSASGTLRRRSRGGTILGVILGLLIGLGIALAVAMYIAKVPVPFIDKVGNRRTPEQEAAEAERLRSWDPNAGLVARGERPALPASAASAPGAVAASQPGAPVTVIPVRRASAPLAGGAASLPGAPVAPMAPRDPAAILAGRDAPGSRAASAAAPAAPAASRVAEGRMVTLNPGYQVQAGAYSSSVEAEQQRARLTLQGFAARVHEREVNGRMVYRVRIGPFDGRDEAERLRERLQAAGTDAIVIPVPRQAP